MRKPNWESYSVCRLLIWTVYVVGISNILVVCTWTATCNLWLPSTQTHMDGLIVLTLVTFDLPPLRLIWMVWLYSVDVTREHPSLGSAPSSYSEAVCMPEFGDRFPLPGNQCLILLIHVVKGMLICISN